MIFQIYIHCLLFYLLISKKMSKDFRREKLDEALQLIDDNIHLTQVLINFYNILIIGHY